MLIQFNLLPDVKKEYIKAKRTKRLIMMASALAAGVSIVVVMLLFSVVQIAQKNNIKDLTTDIEKEIAAIRSIEDLDKILTIQSQLQALPGLHESKPATSRLFGYLNQLTPETVKIRSVELDFEAFELELSGSADSLASINQYVDTLKFSKYTAEVIEDGTPFMNVVSELSRSEESATYTITMMFDPVLFDNTQNVTLVVPDKVTTRSIVGRPSLDSPENSLFEDAEENN